MTRETKVGLLVGMGVILLIGIIVSDHLSVVQSQNPADFTGYAGQAQESIQPMDAGRGVVGDARTVREPAPGQHRTAPVPTPGQLQQRSWPDSAPVNEASSPGQAERLPWAYALDRPNASTPAAARQSQGAEAGPHPQLDASRQPIGTYAQQIAPEQAQPVPTMTIAPQPSQPVESLAAAAPQRTAGAEIVHYVKKGETVYEIAQKYYGNGEYWRTLASHNPGKIKPNGHVNENVRLIIPNRAGLALGDDFVPVSQVGQPVRVEARGTTRQPATIEVQAGDALSTLADKYLGSSARWQELLEANRDQLEKPTDLRAGMTLRLPGNSSPAVAAASESAVNAPSAASRSGAGTYKVQSGDTLTSIAKRALGDGDRWQDIYKANRDKLPSPDALKVGQVLRLP